MKYQCWSYSWSNGYGPIPERPLFGGKLFDSRDAAKSAWYDEPIGANDRMVIVKCVAGIPQHINLGGGSIVETSLTGLV